MELIFGSDHAGFSLKEELKNFLKQDNNYQVFDEEMPSKKMDYMKNIIDKVNTEEVSL